MRRRATRGDETRTLRVVRFWLPLVVTVVGLVLMVVATDLAGLEGGALVVSAGLSIWLLNWLYRVGVTGDRARQDEDDARAFYARNGHWPDEPPPPGRTPAAPPRPDPHRRPETSPRRPGDGRAHGRRR